jgi:tetrahydromethanopterin S-methyltransferase subunit C
MLAWWYVSIGGAFVLLGLRSALRGDPLWSVVVRFVIAAGFVALAAGTFRIPLR